MVSCSEMHVTPLDVPVVLSFALTCSTALRSLVETSAGQVVWHVDSNLRHEGLLRVCQTLFQRDTPTFTIISREIRLPVTNLIQRSWVTGREVAEDAQPCTCFKKDYSTFQAVHECCETQHSFCFPSWLTSSSLSLSSSTCQYSYGTSHPSIKCVRASFHCVWVCADTPQ